MKESLFEKPSADNTGNSSGWLSRMPWIAGGVAAALLLIYLLSFWALPVSRTPEAWGQFGDYVGGLLNPLISLFTLTVAVSVWGLQSKTLVIQKQELAETREAIKQQTFDQFFMSMLASHRSMAEQVVVLDGSTQYSGKHAIDTHLNNLRGRADQYTHSYGIPVHAFTPKLFTDSDICVSRYPSDAVLNYFAAFCMCFYGKDLVVSGPPTKKITFGNSHTTLEQVFGHLFRSTYQILKIIEERFHVPEEDKDEAHYIEYPKLKRRYVNLLRAQMSESEFVFFALSALTKDGEKSWARSIQLNFFEDRLQNRDWTQKLAESFADSKENQDEAKRILKDE